MVSTSLKHRLLTEFLFHSCFPRALESLRHRNRSGKMISDGDLYKLAIFLGTASMVLIVVYHFLEVNSETKPAIAEKKAS